MCGPLIHRCTHLFAVAVVIVSRSCTARRCMIEQQVANVRQYPELRHFGFCGVAQSVRVEVSQSRASPNLEMQEVAVIRVMGVLDRPGKDVAAFLTRTQDPTCQCGKRDRMDALVAMF